ncbi:MAG: CBS domain-containing protein [Alphaproteobacteria bacterium]|nr:MAG: CBS domain-containing protein [Alphaproteobacteria bacterium]
MFHNIFSKVIFFFLRNFLKLWLRFTKKDPSGEIESTVIDLIQEGKNGEDEKIDEDERALLHNVLELKDTQVSSIKIARAEIIALSDTSKTSEIIELMRNKNMSQLIIYKEEIDNILGYVVLEDIMAFEREGKDKFDINTFMKPIDFVSPSLPILDCLMGMRENGQKMAIVVDEYGGVDGLVTFTDLIEEIIGDIQHEETVTPPGQIVIEDSGDVIADGHTRLDDLNEAIGTSFRSGDDDDDVLTIAGMICEVAGRVPSRGEIVQYEDGVEFVVLDATPRKIKRVAIRGVKLKE